MAGNFIELLAVTRPERVPAQESERFSLAAWTVEFLQAREGLAFVVLESSAARLDRQRFGEAGLRSFETVDFSRGAVQPDGTIATLSFSITFVMTPELGHAPHFVCQQHTPEYFWHAAYQDHANKAQAITEVVLVAERPADFATFYAALVAPEAVRSDASGLVVETGRGRITVLAPAELEHRFAGIAVPRPPRMPYIAGLTIRSLDLGQVVATLRAGGIPYWREGGLIRIAPEQAFGAVLEFTGP